jgi:hypothetical protein
MQSSLLTLCNLPLGLQTDLFSFSRTRDMGTVLLPTYKLCRK